MHKEDACAAALLDAVADDYRMVGGHRLHRGGRAADAQVNQRPLSQVVGVDAADEAARGDKALAWVGADGLGNNRYRPVASRLRRVGGTQYSVVCAGRSRDVDDLALNKRCDLAVADAHHLLLANLEGDVAALELELDGAVLVVPYHPAGGAGLHHRRRRVYLYVPKGCAAVRVPER